MANKTVTVKREIIDSNRTQNHNSTNSPCLIDLSSSDSDSDTNNALLLPPGFLDPLPVSQTRQFWKAGDYYQGSSAGDWCSSNGGMDHVRVHPKFLHSNATSHKWVLGAFAELLDNSLDEVCNGATYVSIDMVKSKKDGSKMLLIEDDGGGMDPDKMRHCMSLGYSAKSKMINTIGQYGNGFKTSTMRLGADVIVFSRNPGKDGRPTQSIGLLSYTFLKSTGKEDIVVPMLDYEKRGKNWNKIVRSSAGDWNINVETIVKWSPFSNETDLLRQFNNMKDRGTRIFIYNLWEDDEGLLELDFDTDPHDIQIRGVNRDEKNIEMAKKYPNSKHFLTYKHSLRSYAAVLYLRVPPPFQIILRGKYIEHHNLVNDMMMSQEIVYRPQSDAAGISKESNMVAVVTVGFVKDAKFHIDVQGFNVYHKNRLIKPFWRVWHPPGVQGRGVIGVLEANFVEPAHDKQGFERTTVLARLETKLMQAQKNYWNKYSEKIGYAPANNKNAHTSPSPQSNKRSFSSSGGKAKTKLVDKGYSKEHHLSEKDDVRTPRKQPSYAAQFSEEDDVSDEDNDGQNFVAPKRARNSSSTRPETAKHDSPSQRPVRATRNNANSKDNSRETAEYDSPSRSAVRVTRNNANSKDDSRETAEHDTPSQRPVRATRNNANSKDDNRDTAEYDSPSRRPVRVTRNNANSKDDSRETAQNDTPSRQPVRATRNNANSKDDSCETAKYDSPSQRPVRATRNNANLKEDSLSQLKEENNRLRERLKKKEEKVLGDLLQDVKKEKERGNSLEAQVEEANRKNEELSREQEAMIEILTEERQRRDMDEANLRTKLKDASNMIKQLVEKVKELEQ